MRITKAMINAVTKVYPLYEEPIVIDENVIREILRLGIAASNPEKIRFKFSTTQRYRIQPTKSYMRVIA